MIKLNDITNADWIGILAILLLCIGASIITFVIVTEDINKCTSNPILYSAEKEAGDLNYSYAVLKIYRFKGDLIPLKVSDVELFYDENRGFVAKK